MAGRFRAFDREYQESLISRCMDPGFLSKVAGVMGPGMFDPDLSPAVEAILDFYRRHRRPPTGAQLSRMVGDAGVTLADPGTGCEFDVGEVVGFARGATIRSHGIRAVRMVTDGDVEGAESAMRDALRSVATMGGTSAVGLLDGGRPPGRRTCAAFGVAELDRLTGGVCAGECAAIMAASNGGKTTMLVSMGVGAVRSGLNVLHVSLEMSLDPMREKYLAALDLPKGARAAGRALAGMGRLAFVCRPPATLTMDELRREVECLEFRPSVVLLDSLDNVRPRRAYSDRWAEEEVTAQELVALASDFDCGCVTSLQANRPGFGMQVIDQQHVKGSMDKCRLMSQVVTLNQDVNEAMCDYDGRSVVRFYLAKNRYGPKGAVIRSMAHFASCSFTPVDGQALGLAAGVTP